MKFKKDGKVYDNIDALLRETCFAGTHYHCGSCMIRDKALKEQDSCYAYTIEHQRETAQYFGYEVIEDDTPAIAETVEENSEDVKRKLTRADILHAALKQLKRIAVCETCKNNQPSGEDDGHCTACMTGQRWKWNGGCRG